MSSNKNNSRRSFLQNSVLAATAFSINPFHADSKERSGERSGESNKTSTLFAFDDHNIPWKHNLKITLVEADKHQGNPVVRRGPEGSPDFGHAILYGSVIKVGEKFRMWYLAMSQVELKNGQAPGNWRPMCYAESNDGINWVKPQLGLVDFNGSRRNNICLIEGSPQSLTRINDFLSVLHEPADPDPARRYKAVYIAHVPYEDIKGGLSNMGIKEKTPCVTICAISADGLTWKIAEDRPADAGGERFEVTSLYKFGDFYYTTGQLLSPWTWLPEGRDSGRVIMAYRSPDFKVWSKAKAFAFARPGQLANPSVKGQQTHMGAGLWNRNNVMVGLYGMWQDGPVDKPKDAARLWGTHVDLGLIISNDGIHFREPVTDFKIIARGKLGEWDDVALLQGHAFVNQGEHTMIWYSHWDTGAKLKSMEIGLATLRRDGFGYLSRKEEDNDAHFITTTFNNTGKGKLMLNAEGLSAEAPLKIELLDKLDRPLAGYSGKAAAVVSYNGTWLEINWPGKSGLPVNQKFSVKIGFPVNSTAKVYALYITQG